MRRYSSEGPVKDSPPNTQRIHEFIVAWERRDLEAILVAMSEDVLYENVGLSLSGQAARCPYRSWTDSLSTTVASS